MKKAIVVMGAAVLVASAGVVFAHWQATLAVDATVGSGTISLAWSKWGTDDDGDHLNDLSLTDDGGGTLYDRWGGGSSDDPTEPYRATGYPGGTLDRGNSDAGKCTVSATDNVATAAITNAYPSYFCNLFLEAENDATVPVKATAVRLTILKGAAEGTLSTYTDGYGDTVFGVSFGGNIELSFDFADDIPCGTQLDPEDTEDVVAWFHLEADGDQEATYTWTIEQDFVNWNEWTVGLCTFEVNGDPYP